MAAQAEGGPNAPEGGESLTEAGAPGPGAAGGRESAVTGVDRRNGAVVVSLAGELDLYNAEEVRSALLDACAGEPETLVIDLEQVRFIDSTALGVLIEARSRMAERSGFRLAAPGLETRRALEVSGLDRHFLVHDTVAEALEAAR
ncbi:MAG TPA: STAS domain-containing protein [Gaiellaceae bacterium]|nr:STAS domain-containing protein [Gaiellaceae bacterium]